MSLQIFSKLKSKSAVLAAVMVIALASPILLTQQTHAVDILNNGSSGASSTCDNPDALNTPKICGDNSASSKSNPIFGPNGVLTSAINILSIIVGVAAIVAIIISGLRMIVSNGDSNTFASARNGLIYSAVGLIVAVLAQIIVSFVLTNI
jgi:hypothetical protein